MKNTAGAAIPQPSDPIPPFLVVLGVAQDAGRPQAGCRRPCCAAARVDPGRRRHAACLGLVDPLSHQRWMIDASPDFREQLAMLEAIASPAETAASLDGVLLTHAHIGHYTGLMFVGDESMGAKSLPVHAMPRMRSFLSEHAPWARLVAHGNIDLVPMTADAPFRLAERIAVTPLLVPHRDEYTETVGFRIEGPRRSVLFIPDIDGWERWDRRNEDVLAAVDVAYLDGSFYDEGELPGRDISRIPHPLITSTMTRLAELPASERGKVRFIHLNHTNPALDDDTDATRAIRDGGFDVAREGERQAL